MLDFNVARNLALQEPGATLEHLQLEMPGLYLVAFFGGVRVPSLLLILLIARCQFLQSYLNLFFLRRLCHF
jgi:hypothetical protein